ncbi:MAG TPA: exodeoxyribonuclease VII large subunit [Candidatus Binataceae bacterium]|nr:exodeoxyribonuclease VII large subunit [Candidatus Binataceae bacterium]
MDGQLEFTLKTRRPGALSVTQLVRSVRETLELNLDECWVVGEASNARPAASGHFYFTLKDAHSAINVVMFRAAFRRVRFAVEDGMKIVVRGRVSLFEARGTLQFYAEEIEPRGLGALQLAFEQLKARLQKEGLFDIARKRPLPFLPRTIGIVTALRGAGLRDMLTVIQARFAQVHVIIRAAPVQGAGAASAIAAAIADLNRDRRAEVIILGRGGGSLEDLWAFNEERVARAIYQSEIPVISAVGHEIDYTIADFVADCRAPTPTAAAQMVVPIRTELELRIGEIGSALNSAMRSGLAAEHRNLRHLGARLRDPRALVRQAGARLDEAGGELEQALALRLGAARNRVSELRGRLRGPIPLMREYRRMTARLGLHLAKSGGAWTERTAANVERLATRLSDGTHAMLGADRRRVVELAARLDALSPLRCLERGYAAVINRRDGRLVTDAAAVEVGDELELRLRRGRLRARTTYREV